MKNILCLMTLLLAFLGMMYEYILAHYIASIIGGAYVILFVTFCLFAAALGLGSFIYNIIPEKYKSLKFLGMVQVFITSVVVILPFYFELLNFLFLEKSWSYFLTLSGAAIPVIILGVISGFELPLMFRLAYVNISRLLMWDYIGMFLGVVLFPLIFVTGFHIQTVCFLMALASAVMAGTCFFLHGKSKHPSLEDSLEIRKEIGSVANFKMGLFFVFVMSFCSFAYQGLIGKVVVSIIGDKFASRSYAIGFFILGMALGALWAEKRVKSGTEALRKILKVEAILCILAALSPIILYLMSGSWYLAFGLSSVTETQLTWYGSVILSMLPLLVGVFAGMEMPLVFQWLGLDNEQRESYFLIAANYTAAIFSGALIGFILPNFIGYSFSFLLVILVNMLIFLMVYLNFPKFKTLCLQVMGLILIACVINVKGVYPSRQFFVETFYAKMHLNTFSLGSLKTTLKAIKNSGEVYRIESFFQDIDIVSTEESSIEGKEKLFYLYLNKQPQFNSETITDYHQSMLWAGVSFLDRTPNKILILGGGDGLLATELLKYYTDTQITIIELDAEMLKLAKHNPRIRMMNMESLFSENVNVLVQDAYQYVRKTSERYDLVFVDFPYPTSVDLSRLYSHEFYTGVKQVLTKDGVAIFDAPIITRITGLFNKSLDENVSKIFSTIQSAGFKNPFAFGPYDPFVAVANDNRLLSFTEEVRSKVANSVYTNLHSLEHNLTDLNYDPDKVNYVLKPTIWGMD